MDHVAGGVMFLILAAIVGGHAMYDLGRDGAQPGAYLRMTVAGVQAILSLAMIGGPVH
jgi:hypothetical protein